MAAPAPGDLKLLTGRNVDPDCTCHGSPSSSLTGEQGGLSVDATTGCPAASPAAHPAPRR